MKKILDNNFNIEELANNLTTIRDYLRWATSCFNEEGLFYGHGTNSSWDEAVHLVLQALNLPLDVDNRVLDAHLVKREKHKIIEWVYKRVIDRIPLPYLTKTAWFARMKFYVDQRVLIPRSPIGELICNDFEPWIKSNQINKILDLCTGSGCIGIGCSYVFQNANIILSDISKDALEVAKINITQHQLQKTVQTVYSDLFSNFSNDDKFDLIISNPPYVNAEDLSNMPIEYLKEPLLSLEAGEDGLEIIKKILINATNYLTKKGFLIVEVGNSQYALREKFPNVPFTWLSFENGGDGVFLLTYDELITYKDDFGLGVK